MPSTYTNNLNLELMAAGEYVDTWGDPRLNQNVFTPIDGALGGTLSVSFTNSDVTLTLTQWQNRTFVCSGTLSANVNLIIPLSPNSVGSATACGGDRVVRNACTGNYTLTVKTAATGSSGVVVPQGVTAHVESEGVNVLFADSRLGSTDVSRIPTCAGTPNGTVTGFAGSAYTPAALVFDRTRKIIHVSTADSTSGWVPQSGYFPPPQGYLTPVSGTAVITSDSLAATTLYYTPYVGNLIAIYDGSWLQPYFFSELTLSLTSSQAASQIYDVFAFLDSGTVTIGTGPAWNTATAGSCSRGSGAGTTQLTRTNGIWTNAVSMTARNGASTYSVGVNQGTYLGSIYMDSTNGQVSCMRSYGQSRKWGIWNAYNRVPTFLKAGDGTASWTYTTATIRASNNSTANSLTIFSGLAEEPYDLMFTQQVLNSWNLAGQVGMGLNSTTAFTGQAPSTGTTSGSGVAVSPSMVARILTAPRLGIDVVTCLEKGSTYATNVWYGTESNMMLTAQWRV